MDTDIIVPIARVKWGKSEAILVMNSITYQVNIQSRTQKRNEWIKGPSEFNLTYAPRHIAQEILSRAQTPMPMSDELNKFCHTVLKIAKQRNKWFRF